MLLLDADVMIDLLRERKPALDWLGSVGDAAIALPGYVAMELVRGCQNSADVRALWNEIAPYSILWASPEMCMRVLHIFSRVHLSHSTGLLDTLIAAVALEQDVPLHSFNEKHYRPIPGLTLVQPYERGAA